MRLYDINAQLEALLDQVDEETGEICCDMNQLEALTIAREEKLEGLALYAKNAKAEAAAIREEEKALAERRKALENRADRAMIFLGYELGGEKFHTARVAVNYRSSTAVELAPDFVNKADLWWLRVPPLEPDKQKIKEALKAGTPVPGAELVTRQNMIIK